MWKYYAFRIAGVMLGRLPCKIGYLIARLVADIVYLVSPSVRASIADNLVHVCGDSLDAHELDSAVRRVMRNAGRNYFDLVALPYTRLDDIRKRVDTIKGWENIDKALSRGKGVILATAHLGSFDMAVQLLARHSTRTTVLVESLEPVDVFTHVTRIRQCKGVRFLPVELGALKDIVQCLRNGEIILIACDRDFGNAGLRMPFFGVETTMPTGAVRIAMRTGAAMVPAFCIRRGSKYEVHVEPALDLVSGNDQALVENMTKLVGVLERYIGACPTQWLVTERVWPVLEKSIGILVPETHRESIRA